MLHYVLHVIGKRQDMAFSMTEMISERRIHEIEGSPVNVKTVMEKIYER